MVCVQATMAHFHAMIEGDPQLAGQVGNEQIKMRAVMQVLQVRAANPRMQKHCKQHLLQHTGDSYIPWMPNERLLNEVLMSSLLHLMMRWRRGGSEVHASR